MANSNVYYLAYDGFPTSSGGAFSSIKMYIYNVDEVESWHNIIDITGSATPNALVFDGEKSVFDLIKKTSLELSVIRQDEAWFRDLIDGYDDQWAICVVKDGDMKHRIENVWVGEGGIFSGTLLFYGKLTFQTYSEQYKIASEIRLTFHDRLGVMADEEFDAYGTNVSLLDIVANCVKPCVCSSNLIVEFPYESTEVENASGLEFFALPTSKYAGKKKDEVIQSILKSFGLRLDTDFTYKRTSATYQKPELCGAIWIRHVASQRNSTITHRVYNSTPKIVGADTYDSYTFTGTDTVTSTTTGTSISVMNVYAPVFPSPSGVLQQFSVSVTNSTGVVENETFFFVAFDFQETPGGVNIFGGYNADSEINLLIIRDRWAVKYPDSTLVFEKTAKNQLKITSLYGADYDHSFHFVGTVSEYAKVSLTTSYFPTPIQPPVYLDITPKVINNTDFKLINNASQFDLDIKAKEIVVTWKPEDTGNLFSGGTPKETDFSERSGTLLHKYTRVISEPNGSPYSNLLNYVAGGTVPEPLAYGPRKANYSGSLCIALPVRKESSTAFTNPDVELFVQGPIPATAVPNQKIGVKLDAAAKSTDQASIYINYIAVTSNGSRFYYKDSNLGWEPFTGSISYGSGNSFVNAVNLGWSSLEAANLIPHPPLILGSPEYKLFIVISGEYTAVDLPETIFIKNVEVSFSGLDFPTEIKQTTNLAPKNRKSISVDIDVNTFPGGVNDTLFYRDCLVNYPSIKPCRLLKYEGLDQTLQAHLGDQYGLQYQFDRWLFKCDLLANIKLRDIIRLPAEDKLFIIANGNYDIKRSQFTGELIEFTTTDNKAAWLWNDGGYILWDDGGKILL